VSRWTIFCLKATENALVMSVSSSRPSKVQFRTTRQLSWHRGPDTWVTLFPRFCRGEVWMPWKESSVMDERLRFVARLLDGEQMSEVCREFGISRKTGYKIFTRYKDQ